MGRYLDPTNDMIELLISDEITINLTKIGKVKDKTRTQIMKIPSRCSYLNFINCKTGCQTRILKNNNFLLFNHRLSHKLIRSLKILKMMEEMDLEETV